MTVPKTVRVAKNKSNSLAHHETHRSSRRVYRTFTFAVLVSASFATGYVVGVYQSPVPRWNSPPPSLQADYAFEMVSRGARLGDERIDLRLVHTGTRHSISSAVIFAYRLDMAPDGMPTMTAPLAPEPTPEGGVYRFVTNYAMEGSWRLSVAAKIPGVEGTLSSQITIPVAP